MTNQRGNLIGELLLLRHTSQSATSRWRLEAVKSRTGRAKQVLENKRLKSAASAKAGRQHKAFSASSSSESSSSSGQYGQNRS